MPQTYNVLNKLIPKTLGGNWYWGEYYFYRYFGLKQYKIIGVPVGTYDFRKRDLSVIKDTLLYKIKSDGKLFLIEIKDTPEGKNEKETRKILIEDLTK